MRRTALIWLTIVALLFGGITLPAAHADAQADQVAGLSGGDELLAVPPAARMQAAHVQSQPAGTGSHDSLAVTVDVPSWHSLRTLPGAPPARPVPLLPSDPEAPGTGAAVS